MKNIDIKKEYLDDLCGLYNRRYLNIKGREYVQKANHTNKPLSVLLLDLDHFKNVNDTYGHSMGDSVLVQFASFLEKLLRQNDTVFRYGGDEFICLLPNTDFKQATRISNRFIEQCRTTEFAKIRLTMSIGIASCPEDGSDWLTVFNVADQSLYSAKRHGRDRIGTRTLEEKSLIIPTVEMIGRSSELSLLEDLIESVISSKGNAVCISGEAGVGKSRLFQELFARSSEKSIFVCSNLSPTTCSIPYYPFREILRSLIFMRDEHHFDSLPRVYQIELAKIVPEILRKPVEEGKDVLMVDRFRLFEGVRKFLELQIVNSPMFICIDNIHWADENSFELLHYLVRAFKNKSILFILVYRIEEIQHTAFQDVLHSMARGNLIRKIILKPLEKCDVTRMISSIIDAESPSGLVDYIYKETGGNPFFIEELLKSLKNDGALNWNGSNYELDESSAKTIPYSIEGVIERKLQKLSDKAYSLLEHASVIGRAFSFSFLRAVTEINEGQLFDLLDEIFKNRLLSEKDGEHYFFSENIIREIIYNRMSRTRMSRFHHEVGEKLLSLNSENIEKVVEELSYHFYQCGDNEKTVEFSIIAGDRAKAAYANRDAIRFYTRAIDSSLESSENASTRTKLSECLRNRSSVYNLTGENDLAIADLEKAISHSDLTGDLCDKADSLSDISKVYKDISSYDRAVESAENALKIYRKEKNITGEAFSLTRIAIGKRMLREYEVSISYFQRSLEIVRKHSLHEIEVKALNGMGSSYTGMGDYEKALKLYNESLRLSRKVGDKAGQIASLVNIGNVNYYKGNFGGAIELYRKAMIIIRDIGNRRSEAITCNNLGCICILMGDYSNARKYLSNSLEKYIETGDKVNEAGCNLNLGEMYARHGKIKKAIDLIDDAIRIYENTPDPDGLTKCFIRKGRAFLENNDIKNAGDCFSKAEKVAESIKSSFLIASVLAARTTLHLEEGNIGNARKLLEKLLSLLQKLDSNEIQAEADYLEGRMFLEEGDYDTAESCFNRSFSQFEKLNEKFMLAKVLYYLGMMYEQSGNEMKAEEKTRQSLEIFTELDAAIWLGKFNR